jgi:hypothetical protein
LTKLTLAVLDFALFDADAPDPKTKEVVLYLTADGKPTSSDKAVKRVTVNVPIDMPVRTEDDIKQILEGTVPEKDKYFPKRRSPTFPNAALLELHQRLNALR